MIRLLEDQAESDRLFRRWVDALVDGSTEYEAGWVIEGTGIAFTNDRHGRPGTIENKVLLGIDTSVGKGVVTIVQPEVSKGDKGKLTAIGRNKQGSHLLLRQGWLKANPISREIRKDFAHLTGLTPVAVTTSDKPSSRDWYVVADLSATKGEVLKATTSFAIACSLGRSKAGGGTAKPAENDAYRIGLDEKGRTKQVAITGGTKDVEEMQGHVWAELKKLIGSALTKPANHGYAVDAMIESANLLIEIKTGVSAQDVYEAVGQLALYPSLIKLPAGLKPVLLAPDRPLLRPQMAAALEAEGIAVYFYSIGRMGKEPTITFSPEFLKRCQRPCP